MSGKKFKGKNCVYCESGISSATGDHVFARQFVVKEQRQNLPKVPCCIECNNKKSKLEHYLTAVLPFGGRHQSSSETLGSVVPRLQKNRKLHRKLQNDSTKVYGAFKEKGDEPSFSVPFEAEKLVALAEMIARGLLYYHWEIRVLSDFVANGLCATHEGDVLLSEQFFDGMTGDKLNASIGGGSLSYSVIKSTSPPWLSIWRFSFYDGARMGDRKGQFSDCVWIIIGPKSLVKDFNHL